jgi:hypothetical protein
MDTYVIVSGIDWNPVLSRIQWLEGQSLPTYPGDLKTALLNHAGLVNNPKGEEAYEFAREIARLTTYSDPEIIYWFSRLVSLMNSQKQEN